MINGLQRYATGIAGVVALLAAGCGGPALNGQSKRAPSLPAQQQKFCDRFHAAYAEYGRLTDAAEKEFNPIRYEALKKQIDDIHAKVWNDQYAMIGPSGEFKDWRGNPGFERSGPDTLIFFMNACPGIPGRVGLKTGLFGFPSSSTHILLASPVGQTLASLDMNRAAIVSGKFIWDATAHDHFMPAEDGMSIYWRATGLTLMVRISSIAQAP
jgi:hypothetical protein